jgi:hypothetical protein
MKRAKKEPRAVAPERTPAECEAALVAGIRAWVERLRERSPAEVQARAHELGHLIAGSGDALLFQDRDTDKTIDLYAEALACLAFAPGGVEVLALHFEIAFPEVWWSTDAEGASAD